MRHAHDTTIPDWLISAPISNRLFLWHVAVLVLAKRRGYAVTSVAKIAKELGWKEDTGTQLARQADELGLIHRYRHGRDSYWLIDPVTFQTGKPGRDWAPKSVLTLAAAHHKQCEVYRQKVADAEEAVMDAELAILGHQQGKLNLVPEVAEQLDRAAELNQRIKQHRQMLAEATPGSDEYDKIDEALDWYEMGKEECLEFARLAGLGLPFRLREAKRKLWLLRNPEARQKETKEPPGLVLPLLSPGKYRRMPKSLLTRSFATENGLRDVSGPVRLALRLRLLAKGARDYETTAGSLARTMGCHRNTITRWLDALHAKDVVRRQYVIGQPHREELRYKKQGGRIVTSKHTTVAEQNQVCGVMLTIPENRRPGQAEERLRRRMENLTYRDSPRRSNERLVRDTPLGKNN